MKAGDGRCDGERWRTSPTSGRRPISSRKLEELFRTYGETGGGQKRYYLHSVEEAAEHNGRRA